MATQVRETKAGGAISAFVILNKKGEHVATVNGHYSDGGRVSVDVWNVGTGPVERSFATAQATGMVTPAEVAKLTSKAPDYYRDEESRLSWAAYQACGLQQGNAGGGGYDKFAAAIARTVIDGHTIADHCGSVPEAEKARAALLRQYCKAHDGEHATAQTHDRKYWDKRAARIGASFANYDGEKGRFASLHFTSGLDRLTALGYTVIQAI